MDLDNQTNIQPQSSSSSSRFWTIPVSFYGLLLLVAGTFGNLGLALVMLRDRRRLKLTTRVLFCMLATTDTSVLWIAVTRYWLRVTFNYDFRAIYPRLCSLHVFLVYICTNLGVAVFCTLCVDRCLVIYNSLEGYRLCFIEPLTRSSKGLLPVGTARTRCCASGCCHWCCFQSRPLSRDLIQGPNADNYVGKPTQAASKPILHSLPPHPIVLHQYPCRYSTKSPGGDNNVQIGPTFRRPPSVTRFNSLGYASSAYLTRPGDYWKPSPEFSSPRSQQKTRCGVGLSSRYARHPARYLTIALSTGLVFILIKHLIALPYMEIDEWKGCHGVWIAEWRDYLDFFTQAILSYFIIIPSNVVVYRAIKRHQRVLTALRVSAARGSRLHQGRHQVDLSNFTNTQPSPSGTTKFLKDRCESVSAVPSLVIDTDKSKQQGRVSSSHSDTKAIVATAAHLSTSHLFIFKTLITLSFVHFAVNLPGYLYAQIILPNLGSWWYKTYEGELLYDSLFLISFTNNAAGFFILLITVRGFRSRVRALFKHFCCTRLVRSWLERIRSLMMVDGTPVIRVSKPTANQDAVVKISACEMQEEPKHVFDDDRDSGMEKQTSYNDTSIDI